MNCRTRHRHAHTRGAPRTCSRQRHLALAGEPDCQEELGARPARACRLPRAHRAAGRCNERAAAPRAGGSGHQASGFAAHYRKKRRKGRGAAREPRGARQRGAGLRHEDASMSRSLRFSPRRLESGEGRRPGGLRADDDAHSAKGLEFPVVFLTAGGRAVPHTRSITDVAGSKRSAGCVMSAPRGRCAIFISPTQSSDACTGWTAMSHLRVSSPRYRPSSSRRSARGCR